MKNRIILMSILTILIIFIAACTNNSEEYNNQNPQKNNIQENDIQNNIQNENSITNNTIKNNNTSAAESNIKTNQENNNIEQSNKISIQTLSQHNKQSDCWIAYNGKVYDITNYLPKHPGGASRITPYCGTALEFEKAFTKKHGTSQVNKLVSEGVYKGDLYTST